MRTFIAITLLFFSMNSFGLNPSRTYKQHPEKYKMNFKALDIKTKDGKAKLKAWYFLAKKKTTKLVLISHNGEGNMGDYLRRVMAFTNSGFNVMMYDYRGYGESSEFEIDKNMYVYPHFQDDLETMIDYCTKTFSKSVSLYGWGIGGGLSLGTGYTRDDIDKIIADTPFLSMEDLEERFSSSKNPLRLPKRFNKEAEPKYALNGKPGNKLKGVLLIVGSSNKLITQRDMEELASKNKELIGKNVFVVDNPEVKDNFSMANEIYMKRVLAILN